MKINLKQFGLICGIVLTLAAISVFAQSKSEFNKMPINDLGAKYADAILNKEINLDAPFALEVNGELGANGRLIKPVLKVIAGDDEKITDLMKEVILAMSDSNLLKPFYDVGGRNVKINVSQDTNDFNFAIQIETESESRTKSLQSLMNVFLKNKPPREGTDEAVLFNNVKFAADGKLFKIQFVMPIAARDELVFRNLTKLEEKRKVGS